MDQAIVHEFAADGLEHLDRLEPILLGMEKDAGMVDREMLNAAFRAIHSIKGSSGLAGVWPVRDLSHAMESLLIRFRDGLLQPDSANVSVLLRAVDRLRILINNALNLESYASYDQELRELQDTLGQGEPQAPEPPRETQPVMAEPRPAMQPIRRSPDPSPEIDLAAEIKRLRSISQRDEDEEGGRNYYVLVVEDDKFTARVLRDRIAAQEQFTPVMAGSLAEAAAIIEQGDYSFFVAVLDLTLPDAPDGEIVDYVIEHDIPPIILTATFSDQVRQRILAKSAIDYLLKGGASDLDYLVSLLHRLRKNRHIKVLAVDDSRPQRNMLVSLLRLLNFKILEAENGRQAIKVFQEHPDIRMVITDYNMPQMDGIELVSNLRANYSRDQLSIIGLSSEASATLAAGFLKGGANDFLPKPYTKEEIYSRIIQNLESQENIARIRESSQRDYLTGLPNRRHFFELAVPMHQQAVQQNQALALAMMDIDHFKRINDTYGHAAGDEVLKMVAWALSTSVGSMGLVARLGGEEFAALLAGMEPSGSLVLFNEVRKIVERLSLDWGGRKIKVTISMGLSTTAGGNIDEMLKSADELLYQAKEQGRNRVVMG